MANYSPILNNKILKKMAQDQKQQAGTTKAQSSKLIDRFQRSSEDRKSEEAQHRAKSLDLQLQADTLATQKSLADKKQERERKLDGGYFKWQELVDIDKEIASLENGLKMLEGYKTELF